MRKPWWVPKALAVTLLACGSPHPVSDGGTDAGTDGGATDAGFDDGGTDAGFDDGGTDGGQSCDCRGACPKDYCAPFVQPDGGVLCECAV